MQGELVLAELDYALSHNPVACYTSEQNALGRVTGLQRSVRDR